MEPIGAASGDHDDLRGLIEFRRRAGGQHFELRQGVQRWHLGLAALQCHFIVGDAVQRAAQAAIGVAAAGAGCYGQTAGGHLILRAHALHSGRQCIRPMTLKRPFSGVFWIAYISITSPTEESSVWITGPKLVTLTVS